MPVTDDDEGGAVTAWLPDLLFAGGRFERGAALVCNPRGRVEAVLTRGLLRALLGGEPREGETYDLALSDRYFTARFRKLRGRALLPGMANAHSHAFQRVIRGRTERRAGRGRDSFWTWREMMYSAAERLTPEDLYDASRMAFMEMALGGTTAVGEFHYLHRQPGGAPYDDPNLLAKTVVRAARDVGVRVALLRVAYARSGHGRPPNPQQARFIEGNIETYLRGVELLQRDLGAGERLNEGAPRGAWAGVAPHSVRAVTVEWLRGVREFAAERALPIHMHVAEQPAEIEACVEEHGRTPVELLADEGLLSERFTAVHAVHVTAEEVGAMARAGATVCACPTTERNLGDGVVPADLMFGAGVGVALGTDSHAQIDLLEDARELEYHLRLLKLERNVLAPAPDGAGELSSLAARLFECATLAGARSIGSEGGGLAPGAPADFFTVDLADPSVAGAGEEDLLPAIVFSLSRAAVRETAVGGRLVVEGGRHPEQEEITSRFAALQRRLWGGAAVDEG